MTRRYQALGGIVLLLVCACSPNAAPPVNETEFIALAEKLESGDNRYFGQQPLRDLLARIDDPQLEPPHRLLLLMQLAELETQLGPLDQATAHADEAVQLVAGPAAASAADSELRKAQAAAHLIRAMAYLRLAEQRNCVAHRGAQSCIFPIEGNGVHVDPTAAQQAADSLQIYLARNPDDLEARWLINLVAMTLGQFPDGVAADWLIDPRQLEASQGLPRFTDIAGPLGLVAQELAGGVVVDDIDQDGWLDIVTSTSDPRGSLRYYRNVGDGSFDDQTIEARLHSQWGGLNLIGGDYDNDGDIDLLVLRGAWHFEEGRMRNSLLRNDAGVFTDVTAAAGLAAVAMPTQTACWADFDNDGDLDLYVGNEAYTPLNLDFPSQLFRNNGDGTFVDVAVESGVTNDRYAKGVTVGDYDDDGDLDLYVSNAGPNRLYRNDGELRFTDVAPQLELTGPEPRSFAPWFFDVDNDGDLDLFVGAYEALLSDVVQDYLGEPTSVVPSALYRNNGDGTFVDDAPALGLDRPWMPMGANFGDYDNDGFLDFYLGTGNPNLKTLVPNVALRNVEGVRFDDVTVSSGLGHLQKGHGVAFADIDHDGDQDLFHQLGGFYPSDGFANALFVNPGSPGRQIELELRGVESNRLAIGARVDVRVRSPRGVMTFHRAVGSVSSFGGSPLSRLSIGVGDATHIDAVGIRWPGQTEPVMFSDLDVGAAYRLTEGSEKAERLDRTRVSLPRP